MKSKVIFEKGTHRWIMLGRDADRTTNVIDTNEYIILHDGESMLMDPGGIEIFPQVLSELSRHIEIDSIKSIVASHQDPDIASSLAMWLDLCSDIKIYCSAIWTDFISHFGMGTRINLTPIPDHGMEIPIGSSKANVYAVPAHYCHSSGNFSFYDPIANILFSGDIGGALLPSAESDLYVKDFNKHIQYMEGFHLRWMPSIPALKAWTRRVRHINPQMICPQHGAIFEGENVGKLLDWLDSLTVAQWKHDDAQSDLNNCIWMRWKTEHF
ncbi:MAG: MBL fold metallo-hydrolase [SAR324 cluster bacterium]|nr:MBL fold metallo-hydrolase [SAR324 cluster bacterium]MBF0349932.1 MBL fold metallo-hydrolase [SAR324 cluster bacterium]